MFARHKLQKLQMLKTKFSGLESNIIYRHKLVYLHVTSREMLLTELLLLLPVMLR